MGLPLTMDPKKLGKGPGPAPWRPQLSAAVSVGPEGGRCGPGNLGLGVGGLGLQLVGSCGAMLLLPSPGAQSSPSHWSSAPFSGVKQEQLSPRGQAGPSESLGVPTAQETSVLRGECPARRLPLHSQHSPGRSRGARPRSCPSTTNSPGRSRGWQHHQAVRLLPKAYHAASPPRGSAAMKGHQIFHAETRAWGGTTGGLRQVSCVLQGHLWAPFRAEVSPKASLARGCRRRAPSPTAVPSPT